MMKKEIDEIEKLLLGIVPEKKGTPDVKRETENIINFTQDDFRKGIILREILGPPKGKIR